MNVCFVLQLRVVLYTLPRGRCIYRYMFEVATQQTICSCINVNHIQIGTISDTLSMYINLGYQTWPVIVNYINGHPQINKVVHNSLLSPGNGVLYYIFLTTSIKPYTLDVHAIHIYSSGFLNLAFVDIRVAVVSEQFQRSLDYYYYH